MPNEKFREHVLSEQCGAIAEIGIWRPLCRGTSRVPTRFTVYVTFLFNAVEQFVKLYLQKLILVQLATIWKELNFALLWKTNQL